MSTWVVNLAKEKSVQIVTNMVLGPGMLTYRMCFGGHVTDLMNLGGPSFSKHKHR